MINSESPPHLSNDSSSEIIDSDKSATGVANASVENAQLLYCQFITGLTIDSNSELFPGDSIPAPPSGECEGGVDCLSGVLPD